MENDPLITASLSSSSSNRMMENEITNPLTHIDEQDARFSCNICLEPVKDPIVTQCGHLYCWPCLFRWLKTHHTTCPICKSGVTKENVIPIYIRGSERDPRNIIDENDIDARPIGHRIDATTQNPATAGNLNNFGGMTITSSYGFFPSLFGLQFQNFMPHRQLHQDEADRKYLNIVQYSLFALVLLSLIFM